MLALDETPPILAAGTARPSPYKEASTSETRSYPGVFSVEIVETPEVRIPDEEPDNDQRKKPRIIDMEILSVPTGTAGSSNKTMAITYGLTVR